MATKTRNTYLLEQEKRFRALRKAAQKATRQAYGSTDWNKLDQDTRSERTLETAALWIDKTGIPQGYVQRRGQSTEFTDIFEKNGFTLQEVNKPPASMSEEFSRVYSTVIEAAKEVRATFFRQDVAARRAVSMTVTDQETSEEKEREIADVALSPEEAAGEREEQEKLGIVDPKIREASLLERTLEAMTAAGGSEALKATLFRLHQGQPLFPDQPSRLLPRSRPSENQNLYMTSLAWQDFSGERYYLSSQDEVLPRRNVIHPRYHGPLTTDRAVIVEEQKGIVVEPSRYEKPTADQLIVQIGDSRYFVPRNKIELAPCPTCRVIARFVKARGLNQQKVSGIVEAVLLRALV